MVDMAYFLILLAMYSFCMVFLGWQIGNKDGKKDAKEKYGTKS